LRKASKVWKDPKDSDVYLQDNFDNRWSPHIKIEDKLSFKLLPNASHYIIINTTKIKKSNDGKYNQVDLAASNSIFFKL